MRNVREERSRVGALDADSDSFAALIPKVQIAVLHALEEKQRLMHCTHNTAQSTEVVKYIQR